MSWNPKFKRRLEKLAAFLMELPPKRFNYRHWVGFDWGGAQDLSCGTTGCALGWAATMPAFQRLGLYLKDFRVRLRGERTKDGYDYSLQAATKIFGLTYYEARGIFLPGTTCHGLLTPGSDASAKTVAKHILKFIEWKGKNG